jgi:FtsP/CotA-like multicopper oxidase with cupredoxin domain
MVTTQRKLYFSEFAGATKHPTGGAVFFITVKGQVAQAYDPNEAPKIITHPGAVEDWTIENRTQEVHEFHIHQIHFQVIAINGVSIPPKKRQWYDTFQVPYWDGGSRKYPSITVRMDFRGAVAGEFVYHCHILDHEDAGMMANILVTPNSPPKSGGAPSPTHQASGASGKVKKASVGGAATRA